MIVNNEDENNGYDVELNDGDCAIIFPKDCSTPFLVFNGEMENNEFVPENVVIAARALVPPGKTLESGFLYVGSPCKKARALTEKELSFFTYSAANYVDLKNEFLKTQSNDN